MNSTIVEQASIFQLQRKHVNVTKNTSIFQLVLGNVNKFRKTQILSRIISIVPGKAVMDAPKTLAIGMVSL